MGAAKIKDLKEKTSAELISKRRDLKQESLTLRIQQQTGQLENTALLRSNRREVAKIETILSERRLASGGQPEAAKA